MGNCLSKLGCVFAPFVVFLFIVQAFLSVCVAAWYFITDLLKPDELRIDSTDKGLVYQMDLSCGCVFLYDHNQTDELATISLRPCEYGNLDSWLFYTLEQPMNYYEFARYALLQGHKTTEDLTNI